MNSYYQFNSKWYLYSGEEVKGPFMLSKVITMYYEGSIKGGELWRSSDGKITSFTDSLLANLRKPLKA